MPLSVERADWLVDLCCTQIEMQSQRLAERLATEGVGLLWMADLEFLLGAAARFGRTLEKHPGQRAQQALDVWREATSGVKTARDVLEHGEDWLAGTGLNPRPKGQRPSGLLHRVEVLTRTPSDGTTEVLAVDLFAEGTKRGPENFVFPDAILGAAGRALAVLRDQPTTEASDSAKASGPQQAGA